MEEVKMPGTEMAEPYVASGGARKRKNRRTNKKSGGYKVPVGGSRRRGSRRRGSRRKQSRRQSRRH